MNEEFSFLLPDTQLPKIKEAASESVEQLDRNVLSDSDIEELMCQEPLNQSPQLSANETENREEEHAEYI